MIVTSYNINNLKDTIKKIFAQNNRHPKIWMDHTRREILINQTEI